LIVAKSDYLLVNMKLKFIDIHHSCSLTLVVCALDSWFLIIYVSGIVQVIGCGWFVCDLKHWCTIFYNTVEGRAPKKEKTLNLPSQI